MEIILAALVSGLAQYVKKDINNEYLTILFVAALSLALGGIYSTLVYLNYWNTVLQVFTISGAIYAYIILRFENPTPPPTV